MNPSYMILAAADVTFTTYSLEGLGQWLVNGGEVSVKNGRLVCPLAYI